MSIIRKKHRFRQRAKSKKRRRTPINQEEYFASSARAQETWNRVAHVISKMRKDGLSLHRASAEFGIDPRTVTRLGKAALRKRANGRYATKARDPLLRALVIPTHTGLAEIAIRDSHAASQLAEYWNAVQWFLETGDASALRPFNGQSIVDADGHQIPLLTDLNELERLGSAGVLSFESIYARAS